MAVFDEVTPQPFTTGAGAVETELYRSTQPQAAVERGFPMRLWFRAKAVVALATGSVVLELNHVELVPDGFALAADDDLVVDLLLWRTGETQGTIGGTITAADGTVTRVVDADVVGLAWNRQQQLRVLGTSTEDAGLRLEKFGIKRS